jgi:hypothetical protein
MTEDEMCEAIAKVVENIRESIDDFDGKAHAVDNGVGSYEYWGFKGNDVQIDIEPDFTSPTKPVETVIDIKNWTLQQIEKLQSEVKETFISLPYELDCDYDSETHYFEATAMFTQTGDELYIEVI